MEYEIKKLGSTGSINFTRKWLKQNLGLDSGDMVIVKTETNSKGEKFATFKKFDPAQVFTEEGKEPDNPVAEDSKEKGTEEKDSNGLPL